MKYCDILHAVMQKHPEVVALTAEARAAVGTIPIDFPDRFFDFGIAEQNLVSAAAGMAAMGKVPFIHVPIAAFITMRPFEQIRTTVAMQGFNVKIAGLLPGFSAGFQGPTHLALEDIHLMRGIPGMTVMSCSSHEEMKAVAEHSYARKGAVYFQIPGEMPERLTYCCTPTGVTSPRMLREGKDGLVLTYGGMSAIVVEAARTLAGQGVDLAVVNLCALDPAPIEELALLIKSAPKVATVEEHFITGGLGSIIAEIIADHGLGKQLLRVGVEDKFPDRYTNRVDNLAYIGLDAAGVAEKLGKYFR
jgi:transketolase